MDALLLPLRIRRAAPPRCDPGRPPSGAVPRRGRRTGSPGIETRDAGGRRSARAGLGPVSPGRPMSTTTPVARAARHRHQETGCESVKGPGTKAGPRRAAGRGPRPPRSARAPTPGWAIPGSAPLEGEQRWSSHGLPGSWFLGPDPGRGDFRGCRAPWRPRRQRKVARHRGPGKTGARQGSGGELGAKARRRGDRRLRRQHPGRPADDAAEQGVLGVTPRAQASTRRRSARMRRKKKTREGFGLKGPGPRAPPTAPNAPRPARTGRRALRRAMTWRLAMPVVVCRQILRA